MDGSPEAGSFHRVPSAGQWLGHPKGRSLSGKIVLENTKLFYSSFISTFISFYSLFESKSLTLVVLVEHQGDWYPHSQPTSLMQSRYSAS